MNLTRLPALNRPVAGERHRGRGWALACVLAAQMTAPTATHAGAQATPQTVGNQAAATQTQTIRSAADNALPATVAAALQRAQVPADALAAVVLPAFGPAQGLLMGRRATAPWQWQADRPMAPASTMKLVTSIVALDQLGPNHRGFTELLSSAPQQGDVLAGDLVLRGGADPEFDLPQLWALLAELRWLGIREIAGDILLDRTLFRFRPTGPTETVVGPFDAWPEFPYNAVPDALQLNNNLLGLEISSEDPAQPGRVVARALPPLPGLQIDASGLRLTDRPCRDWGEDWVSPALLAETAPGQLRITLQGGFPRACSQRTGLALIDRDALAERHLRWVWQSLGGQWTGRVRDAAALPQASPAEVRLLVRRQARPWGEVLRMMNKRSDNPAARLLYLSLGLDAMAGEPTATTAELAARAVRSWLTAHDIASVGLVLDNGSGLSRSERITPRQLARMLQAAQAGRWAPELMMSLPVAGVDGSMRNRLKTGPASGWARLKTGSIKDVVALAGVVPDAQGRPWVLVAMINHAQASAARPALDALVDWVGGGGVAGGGMLAPGQAPR